jgi:hypothetical protein
MAFALLSRSRSKPPGSVKPMPKQKSAGVQRPADSRSGFAKPVFQLPTTALPRVPVIQTKLKIGEPNGKLEQEADRVAEPADPAVSGVPMRIQRFLGQSNGQADAAPVSVDQALASPGQPLDPATRGFMEPRFGHDFSRVRIHTDTKAAESAKAVSARAFTVGGHVVFGEGQYRPTATEGQQLIAHELTPVMQQGSAGKALQHEPDKACADADRQAHFGKTLEGVRRTERPGLDFLYPKSLMRKVAVPTGVELELEIGFLRVRLAELIDREQKEGKSLADRSTVERRLAQLEKAAAASDPARQEIVFLRERIRQLRDELKAAPLSSAREEIARNIEEHERQLARDLEDNVARLEQDLSGLHKTLNITPVVGKQISAAETELLANEAELKVLRRVFTSEKAGGVAQIYKKEVTPDISGHCMGAVYKGMEAIYSPKVSSQTKDQVIKDSRKILKETGKDTNDVDRIMETLRQHSMAGEKVVVKYSLRLKAWEPSVEKTVLDMVSADYPGWYFFGLSVSGGYHSVILAVDNSDGTPRIYWMDQYSKGFTKEVTGKLDKEMKVDWLEPSYGFADSTVWPLIPTAGAVVEVK